MFIHTSACGHVRGCVLVDWAQEECKFVCDNADTHIHACVRMFVCVCVCAPKRWVQVGVEFTQALPAA